MNAVVIRGVVKCYGNKKDEQRILNYLNMVVKYGSMYVKFYFSFYLNKKKLKKFSFLKSSF